MQVEFCNIPDFSIVEYHGVKWMKRGLYLIPAIKVGTQNRYTIVEELEPLQILNILTPMKVIK